MTPPPPVLDFAGQPACQQDPTSCGAAALVVARAGVDPAYARWLAGEAGRFTRAQEAMRRSTAAAALGPAPWPRGLGTPPWTAAQVLQGVVGRPVRAVTLGPRQYADGTALRVLEQAAEVAEAGLPVVLYTGHDLLARTPLRSLAARSLHRWAPFLPRHVVLALPPAAVPGAGPGAGGPEEGAGEGALRIYEPGTARVSAVSPSDLLAVAAQDAAPTPQVSAARRAMGGWTRVCRVLLPSP